MVIVLDGSAMTDRAAAHSHLAERLMLPTYYGRNLDALYDVLTEIGIRTELVLEQSEVAKRLLGSYGESLLETMAEAAAENSNLIVTLK